ncbi:MAG: hypothetical protein ACFBWO_01930 [Paracoccaceae bacterium]
MAHGDALEDQHREIVSVERVVVAGRVARPVEARLRQVAAREDAKLLPDLVEVVREIVEQGREVGSAMPRYLVSRSSVRR